mmetsp:Transcript_33451/g.75045  ORF Transcript_33451/g.75045 Transcript_33451/m.75045 type:complete len:225 (-) Transcript_33451:72-746(-)
MSLGNDRPTSVIDKHVGRRLCLREWDVRMPAGLEVEPLHERSKLREGIRQAIVLLSILRPRLHDAHLRDHVPPQADHPVRLAEEERNASLPQSVGEEEEMFLREIRDDDAGEVIEEVQVRHDDLACVLVHRISFDFLVQLQQVLHDLVTARLSYALLRHKEVVSEVALAHTVTVNDSEGAYSRQDQVLQHLSCYNCGVENADVSPLQRELPAFSPESDASVLAL